MLLFAATTLGFGTFTFAADTRLFVECPLLHLLENAFFGQFALEDTHRLVERTFDPDLHKPPLADVESTIDNKATLTQCQPKPIASLCPAGPDCSEVADHAKRAIRSPSSGVHIVRDDYRLHAQFRICFST